MAEEREVVRQRFDLRETTRRRGDERLLLRFPKLGYALTRALTRRPPSSRLRRAVLRHAVRRALEAANRGDYEAAFALIPPWYETHAPPELVGLGFERVYTGPEERLRLQRQWIDTIGDFKQEPGEIIDTGDQVLFLTHMSGAGVGSGAKSEGELVYLITVSEGRLVREDMFRSRAEALETAGLSADRGP
jgi:hypothetical protein